MGTLVPNMAELGYFSLEQCRVRILYTWCVKVELQALTLGTIYTLDAAYLTPAVWQI